MAVLAFQGLERAHVRISIYRRYILIPGGTWVKKSKLSRPIRSHPYLLFSMHLTSLFATAVAIIPLASAVAIHTNESYLESDTYAARAWINQQDYQRNGAAQLAVATHACVTAVKCWRGSRVVGPFWPVVVRLVAVVTALVSEGLFVGPDKEPVPSEEVARGVDGEGLVDVCCYKVVVATSNTGCF